MVVLKKPEYNKPMREDKNENKPKVYGCIGMFVLWVKIKMGKNI